MGADVCQLILCVDRSKVFPVVRSPTADSSPSFIACIVFYPRDRPYTVPAIVSIIYTGYLFISLVIAIVIATTFRPIQDRKDLEALFLGSHVLFVNVPITLFGFASLFPQTYTIRDRPRDSGHGALSLVGLAVQAAVFLLLGLTWPARLAWPYPVFERAFFSWFQAVGYVPFHYIMFSVVQAVLLLIAVRHSGWSVRVDEAHDASEEDPLL